MCGQRLTGAPPAAREHERPERRLLRLLSASGTFRGHPQERHQLLALVGCPVGRHVLDCPLLVSHLIF